MTLSRDDIGPSASAASLSTIMPAGGVHPTFEVGGGPDDAVLHIRGVVRRGSVGLVRRKLEQVLDEGASTVVVDFSAVPQCDCRVLAVLDAVRRRMQAVHGRFVLRGLEPEALTGFAGASLRDLLAAYRASPGIGQPLWPGEPVGAGPTGRCTDGERLLARVCVGLASSPGQVGSQSVVELGRRLTAQCVRHLEVTAAVLLLPIGEPLYELSVVAASPETAGPVARIAVEDGQGPIAQCLRTGEPCSVPDLNDCTATWPNFAGSALHHGWQAVRALPLRLSTRRLPGQSRAGTTGVLCLFSNAPGPMAVADLGVAQAFADLATIAMTAGPNRRG